MKFHSRLAYYEYLRCLYFAIVMLPNSHNNTVVIRYRIEFQTIRSSRYTYISWIKIIQNVNFRKKLVYFDIKEIFDAYRTAWKSIKQIE